jgi:hypothetical protein
LHDKSRQKLAELFEKVSELLRFAGTPTEDLPRRIAEASEPIDVKSDVVVFEHNLFNDPNCRANHVLINEMLEALVQKQGSEIQPDPEKETNDEHIERFLSQLNHRLTAARWEIQRYEIMYGEDDGRQNTYTNGAPLFDFCPMTKDSFTVYLIWFAEALEMGLVEYLCRCRHCDRLIFAKRKGGRRRYCGEKCKNSHWNQKKSRKETKKLLAQRRRSEGHSGYHS